jgi:hypothetical protein
VKLTQTDSDLLPTQIKERPKHPTTLSYSAVEANPKISQTPPMILVMVLSVAAAIGAAFLLPRPTENPREATKRLVEVSFFGAIEGVDIYEGEKRLGALPYSLQVEASDLQRNFTFQKEGHVYKTKSIWLNNNQIFEISLEKLPAPEEKPSKPRVAPLKGDPAKKLKGKTSKPTSNRHTVKGQEPINSPTKPKENKSDVLTPCFLDPSQTHCKK